MDGVESLVWVAIPMASPGQYIECVGLVELERVPGLVD
jgi:hypothetical protein